MFLFNKIIGSITTTNNTPVTVGVYDMLPSTTSMLEAVVVAVAADGTSASWRLAACGKRVGSGAGAQVGAVVSLVAPKDVGVAWTAVLAVSGNAFVVTITGAAATTIRWTIQVDGSVTQ